MPIKNIAEYIFPLILIIAATLLSLNEKRNNNINTDSQNRVRNIRRKVGIFMMNLTAILIAIGIYKLQHNNFDVERPITDFIYRATVSEQMSNYNKQLINEMNAMIIHE